MLPEKYIEDIESSARRKNIVSIAGVSTFFIFSALLLGPLIHEYLHIAVLKFLKCPYSFEYGFQLLRGIYGSVNPYCNPGSAGLILFYSSGYLGTLLLGGALSAISMRSDDRKISVWSGTAGAGLLVSILFSIGLKGDIKSIISLLDLHSFHGTLAKLFIITGVFITSLRVLEHFFRLERQE